MKLTIANISTKVPAAQLQAAVAALNRQVSEQFQPEWGIEGTLTGITAQLGSAPLQGSHDAIIYLGDSVQDHTTGIEQAFGYHSDNHAGVPYGFVYLDICKEYGEDWSGTLSHEVLELLADPMATATVPGPAPRGGTGQVAYDLEVCDPTQGDFYTIDSITVSNFVGRAYFRQPGGSGKMNYLGLELTPFGVRPKGYFQYEVGNRVEQVNGALITPGQLAAKEKMGKYRRNARRKSRMKQTGVSTMSAQQGTRSLREVMATNPELRRKAQKAAMYAAYNVITDAGVKVTAADVAEAQADLAALTIPATTVMPASAVRADTTGDIIDGVGTAAGIAISLGF